MNETETSVTSSPRKHELPKNIAKFRRDWGIRASWFRRLQVILAVFAVSGSILMATQQDGMIVILPRLKVAWVAYLTALAVAFLSSLKIGGQANKFREAWKRLNSTALRFENGGASLEDLHKAYEEGEDIIGKWNPTVGEQ